MLYPGLWDLIAPPPGLLLPDHHQRHVLRATRTSQRICARGQRHAAGEHRRPGGAERRPPRAGRFQAGDGGPGAAPAAARSSSAWPRPSPAETSTRCSATPTSSTSSAAGRCTCGITSTGRSAPTRRREYCVGREQMIQLRRRLLGPAAQASDHADRHLLERGGRGGLPGGAGTGVPHRAAGEHRALPAAVASPARRSATAIGDLFRTINESRFLRGFQEFVRGADAGLRDPGAAAGAGRVSPAACRPRNSGRDALAELAASQPADQPSPARRRDPRGLLGLPAAEEAAVLRHGGVWVRRGTWSVERGA